jgi:integrase
MAKRAKGEGTVRRHKSGLWEARLSIPGRGSKSFYGKTQEKALRKRDEARATTLDVALDFDAEHLSFGEFLLRWLSDSVKGSTRERTYDKHESVVRVHLLPALGSVKLKKLTAAHLQGLYHQRFDQGLSGQTVKGIHATANRALGQAVRWRLIPYNPAKDTDRPRVESKEVETLSREEVGALFEAARDNRLEALFVVAVLSGLRIGELLGLKWEDVDLRARTLRVRRQLIRARSGIAFAPPKRNASKRAVEVGERALDALRRHRRVQLEEKLRAGSLWQENDLVFTTKEGKPLEPATATQRYLHPVLERAGVKRVGFHALRHTFATLHLLNGEHVKVVQEALGHSTIAETMNRYSPVLPSMQAEAAKRLDALF